MRGRTGSKPRFLRKTISFCAEGTQKARAGTGAMVYYIMSIS